MVVRPNLSANFPATRLPTPPMPITIKAAKLAQVGLIPLASKLASKKIGIQAHMAYSSHIWPR